MIGIRSFAVCSDSDVGKKKDDDNIVVGISDLKFPATTNPQSLVKAFKARDLFKPNEATWSSGGDASSLRDASQERIW